MDRPDPAAAARVLEELIRLQRLPEDYGQRLDAYVRDKFAELWQAAQSTDPE